MDLGLGFYAHVVVGVVRGRALVRVASVMRRRHVLGHAVASDPGLTRIELFPESSRDKGLRVDAIVLRDAAGEMRWWER